MFVRDVYILSKILTNASYTFILGKNKLPEMGRKDFLCSIAAFFCTIHMKECIEQMVKIQYIRIPVFDFSV